MTEGQHARAAHEPPRVVPVRDELFTVPNILSMLRLVGVPVFLWLIVTGEDLWALLVLALSGVSDYLDGKIARRYDLVSRLGQVLDPIADRLYIFTTVLGLAYRDVIPWWLVLVLFARDAFIVGMYPVVRFYRLPVPEVDFVGKAATFNLLYAFPLLLLGEVEGWVGTVGLPIGWAFAWWGTALYWVAGIGYARQVVAMTRERRAQLADLA